MTEVALVSAMSTDTEETRVEFGQAVYTDEGAKLGVVRAFDEHGFYVTVGEGVETTDDDRPGMRGEADIMWRCWSCGEMGAIADIPEGCPACGAPKEDIYYWQED